MAYVQYQVRMDPGSEPELSVMTPAGRSPRAPLTPEVRAALRAALVLAFGQNGEDGRPAEQLDAMAERWAKDSREAAQAHADKCAANLARVSEFAS